MTYTEKRLHELSLRHAIVCGVGWTHCTCGFKQVMETLKKEKAHDRARPQSIRRRHS